MRNTVPTIGPAEVQTTAETNCTRGFFSAAAAATPTEFREAKALFGSQLPDVPVQSAAGVAADVAPDSQDERSTISGMPNGSTPFTSHPPRRLRPAWAGGHFSPVNWRVATASCLLLLLAVGTALAAEGAAPESAWRRVEIGATWTSIYVGTVSLRMPEFKRNAAGEYESTYAARVLPWLFQNENGRISIRVSDDALRRLARGETIEFDGRAVNQAGEERAVTGRAAPADATSGRIKVRVGVSPKVELIFNTTYRFSGS